MSSLKNLIRSIGPGILFAGAAVGVSHIMQSTRAGANFGFGLLVFVILSNFFKYPFFEYGHRYTASTGKTIIEGYSELGKPKIWIFFLLNHVTGIIASAGVTILTGALLNQLLLIFFDVSFDLTLICSIILFITLVILLLGKYSLLDNLIKALIVALSLSTVVAVFMAFDINYNYSSDLKINFLLENSTILFLIALMGWMPAPIEAASWSSLWALEKSKETGYSPNLREALMDFKIGYIGTAILAIFFLSLGAFVMHSSGETFSNNNIEFTGQLINLYTSSFGEWSKPLISIIALITMVSTTLTVLDAYPRSLKESIEKINKNKYKYAYIIYLIVISIIALIIIEYFKNKLKLMIDIATISSFIAAPYFAWINFKLVRSNSMSSESKPGKFMRVLSYLGLAFLIIFSIIFINTFIQA